MERQKWKVMTDMIWINLFEFVVSALLLLLLYRRNLFDLISLAFCVMYGSGKKRPRICIMTDDCSPTPSSHPLRSAQLHLAGATHDRTPIDTCASVPRIENRYVLYCRCTSSRSSEWDTRKEHDEREPQKHVPSCLSRRRLAGPCGTSRISTSAR